MSELKITKEKVLDAASKSSTAKEVLKVLFPEAFEGDSVKLAEQFIVLADGTYIGCKDSGSDNRLFVDHPYFATLEGGYIKFTRR